MNKKHINAQQQLQELINLQTRITKIQNNFLEIVERECLFFLSKFSYPEIKLFIFSEEENGIDHNPTLKHHCFYTQSRWEPTHFKHKNRFVNFNIEESGKEELLALKNIAILSLNMIPYNIDTLSLSVSIATQKMEILESNLGVI